MGKNTDKLYITHSEWGSGAHTAGRGADGISKEDRDIANRKAHQMPFWTCGISQQPIQQGSGLCDDEGNVFDIRNILPLLRKNGGVNPVTGGSLDSKDLIQLIIEKNPEGSYIDPVSYKEFRPFSEVVVIRPSGRVYFESTVMENNIKPKYWRDLVSDEEFKKKDIIKLKGGSGLQYGSFKGSGKELEDSKQVCPDDVTKKRTTDDDSAPSRKKMLTSHHMAAGFTSTYMDPVTKPEYLDIPLEKLLKPKVFNETGYASIQTNLGSLNIELYGKYAPKAVYNFIQLAQEGAYNNVKFALNIKHTMLVSGKAVRTVGKGSSAFGAGFSDEIQGNPNKLESRGMLFMENGAKKNNNKSMFVVTYRRCPHLDGKVTVFGRVVGGLDVLDKLELSQVDQEDRPVKDLICEKVKIIADPISEKLAVLSKT